VKRIAASFGRPLLVALVAFVAFASAVRNSGWVFDDHVLIERNTDLRRGDIWKQALVRDYYATSQAYGVSGYYRPVAIWSKALDIRLWKRQPPGFRLTNLILHALASLAAMAALRALGARSGAAWIAALLFAVHPAHAESVAFISGRVDVLAALGIFAALAFAASAARFAWIGVGAASLFAFLSKEISIVLPFLLVLAWRATPPETQRRLRITTTISRAPQYIALGVAAGIALLLRATAIEGLLPTTAHAERITSPMTLPLRTLFFALGAVYAPLRALAVEPDPARIAFLRWGLGALIGAAAWFAAWRADPAARSFLRRALVAGGVALLPTLNLLPQETPLSERYLYLSSAFLLAPFGVLAAAGWRRGSSWQPLAAGATAIAVLVLLLVSAWRAQFWRDDIQLWQRAVAEEPNRAAFYDRLGLALTERRMLGPAEAALRRAVALDPAAFNAQFNLGVFLQTARRPAEAIEVYRKVLELQPRHVNAHLNLGMTLSEIQQKRAALDEFVTAVRIKPDHPEALRLAGMTARDLGLIADARRYLQAALQLQPNHVGLRAALEGLPATPPPAPSPPSSDR
jgi:tetratricopeptide (TPR) repeat protein